jgi:hypothetical protein
VIFPDRRVGAVIGVCLLVGGWVCLHDAYSRRNTKMPLALRPFYPWG